MILELIKVELKIFFRNPGILFWAFGLPLLMAGALGLAFTNKIENTRKISVVEESPSTQLKSFVENKKVPEGSFTNFLFFNDTEKNAILKMKRGEIALYISKDKESKEIEYHFDPNNNESYLSYLLLKSTINWNGKTKQESQIKPIQSKGTRYIDFLIPGMLALGIMNSCVWGTGYTLVEYRIKKLMRRLMATPLPKTVFLFSHICMRFVLNGLEFLFLMLFGYFAFDVVLQGSMLALFLSYLAGNFVFSGIAILVSSRTENVQIANGLINLVFFPMTLCSGIFFSYHNFPPLMESVVKYFPLTLLADSLRALYIEGAGITEVIPAVIIMFIMGLLFFIVGLKIFKWD